MKRDMDLVREILLAIESADEPPSMSELNLTKSSDYHEALLAYHIQMLIEEAVFVRGVDAGSNDGPDWVDLEITWNGPRISGRHPRSGSMEAHEGRCQESWRRRNRAIVAVCKSVSQSRSQEAAKS